MAEGVALKQPAATSTPACEIPIEEQLPGEHAEMVRVLNAGPGGK